MTPLPKEAAHVTISLTYRIDANYQTAIQTPLLLQAQASRLSGSTRATDGIWTSSGKGDFHWFVKAFAIVFGSSHI